MPQDALEPSIRIQQTGSAVIDDLLIAHGDNVRFNTAPGAVFYGISPTVQRKASTFLQRPHVSKYGDVLGLRHLRNLWAHVITHASCPEDAEAIHEIVNGSDAVSSCFPNHELMITSGANQAFVNVVQVITDPGDEILLILPYYFSHHNAILMTGAVPVCVPVSRRTLLPTIDEIESRITGRCKAVVVVNPANPTGMVYPRELLDEIRDLCKRKGVWLILDEAYREFSYIEQVGKVAPVYSPQPDDGVIKIYTMSKIYGMAGWRIGGVLYPLRLSDNMRKAQDTIATHGCIFSQEVAFEALKENPVGRIHSMRDVRNIFIRWIGPVYKQGLEEYFMIPNGAFYLFLPYDMSDDASKERDGKVVDILATEWDTLVTPGYIFGMAGYIRVSYGSIHPSEADEVAANLAKSLKSIISMMEDYVELDASSD